MEPVNDGTQVPEEQSTVTAGRSRYWDCFSSHCGALCGVRSFQVDAPQEVANVDHNYEYGVRRSRLLV